MLCVSEAEDAFQLRLSGGLVSWNGRGVFSLIMLWPKTWCRTGTLKDSWWFCLLRLVEQRMPK